AASRPLVCTLPFGAFALVARLTSSSLGAALAVRAFAGFAGFSAFSSFSTFSTLSALSSLAAAAFLVATGSLHRCQGAARETTNPPVELGFGDQRQCLGQRQAQPAGQQGRAQLIRGQLGHQRREAGWNLAGPPAFVGQYR